mgnify:FL=1
MLAQVVRDLGFFLQTLVEVCQDRTQSRRNEIGNEHQHFPFDYLNLTPLGPLSRVPALSSGRVVQDRVLQGGLESWRIKRKDHECFDSAKHKIVFARPSVKEFLAFGRFDEQVLHIEASYLFLIGEKLSILIKIQH